MIGPVADMSHGGEDRSGVKVPGVFALPPPATASNCYNRPRPNVSHDPVRLVYETKINEYPASFGFDNR